MSGVDDLKHRLNAVNNDVRDALGHLDHAVDLLRVWVHEHPDDELLAGKTRRFITDVTAES